MEQVFEAFRDLTRIGSAPSALIHARSRALATRIPLLYLILIINMLLLAYAYHGEASQLNTVWLPGALTLICAWRAWAAYHFMQSENSDEAAVRRQRKITVLAGILSVVFLVWALNLYPHGGAIHKAHLIFFVAITGISCILCLIHLPSAATSVTIVVTVPFSLYLLIYGEPGVGLIAANMLIVISVLVYILLAYTRDFARMIHTQQALDAKRLETERLSNENFKLAHHDSLTNLANRRSFFHNLRSLVEERKRSREPLHFGVLDLDGFKPINDTYGHMAGDEVLREVGRRLASVDSCGARFGRLGGDEFAVVVPQALSPAELASFGEKLCALLSLPYNIGEFSLNLSATAGFADFDDQVTSVEQLYDGADYALYSAKREQRGGVRIFTRNMREQYEKAQRVEQLLNRADLESELFLEFQPIIDAGTGAVVAMEALARWNSPQLGRVAPDKFIAVAERSTLIHRLTVTLLGKALAAAKSWPAELQLSFNLSVRDLTSREAMLKIFSMIESGGFPASRLIVEVTETALMRDYEAAVEALALLKRLGVKIALDDFGTGYSSLSYVHQLPLDKIKIDRSFVRALSNGRTSRDVVRTIVQLCDTLHLDCVAEGIETQGEADALRALGCNRMQGYLFARPMSTADALAFLAQHETERSAA